MWLKEYYELWIIYTTVDTIFFTQMHLGISINKAHTGKIPLSVTSSDHN